MKNINISQPVLGLKKPNIGLYLRYIFMSADSQNITSSEIYSKMGYAFLMFITDYYRRANEFGLNIDEVMVAQVVAAQFSYKLNQEKSKSFEEMKNLSNKDIQKAFQGKIFKII